MEPHELAKHGVVSTPDLASAGLDPSTIRRWVRTGRLLRLIRGWYAVWPPGDTIPPWEAGDAFDTARARHRLLTVALLRSFEGRVVASHQSALVLHGCRLWRSDLDTAHLCRTEGDHSRHRAAAVIHPACGQPAVETGDGLATVPLAIAVVQVGLYPPSEPQLRRPMESLIAADAALHDELITGEQLEQAVELHVGHPGIHQVRHLVTQADGRHESVGETRLALVMRELGFRFTPQVWVAAGGRRWRTDFMLDDDPVAIEFDGLTKYGAGLESPTPAQLRSALASEKWREDRLRDEGNQVVRFVWTELDDRGLIGRRLDEAVARARRGRSA